MKRALDSTFKKNDWIARTWPSGKVTLGIAVRKFYYKSLLFESKETYLEENRENGVIKGHIYGKAKCIFYQHRLATIREIKAYLKKHE